MSSFMDYTAYHIRRQYEILNGLSNEQSNKLLEKCFNSSKNFIFPERLAKEYKEFLEKSKTEEDLHEE